MSYAERKHLFIFRSLMTFGGQCLLIFPKVSISTQFLFSVLISFLVSFFYRIIKESASVRNVRIGVRPEVMAAGSVGITTNVKKVNKNLNKTHPFCSIVLSWGMTFEARRTGSSRRPHISSFSFPSFSFFFFRFEKIFEGKRDLEGGDQLVTSHVCRSP